MAANQHLYSSIRNPTGKARYYDWLPPHGRTLKPGEEFTFLGSLTEAVRKHGRSGSMRNLEAMDRAVQEQTIEVRHTPAPVLESQSQGLVRQVILTNDGNLSTRYPGDVASDSLSNAYVYYQDGPSATWTITHNLDEATPTVNVYSSGGGSLNSLATITYIDRNSLRITFATTKTGRAIIV